MIYLISGANSWRIPVRAKAITWIPSRIKYLPSRNLQYSQSALTFQRQDCRTLGSTIIRLIILDCLLLSHMVFISGEIINFVKLPLKTAKLELKHVYSLYNGCVYFVHNYLHHVPYGDSQNNRFQWSYSVHLNLKSLTVSCENVAQNS